MFAVLKLYDMKEIYGRLSSIVSVRIFDKRRSNIFKYFDKEFNIYTYKNWFQKLFLRPVVTIERHSGWTSSPYLLETDDWRHIKDELITEEEILKDDGHLIIDKKLYTKPYVSIRFTNKDIYEKRFDTIEDAKEYVEKLIEGNPEFKKLIEI